MESSFQNGDSVERLNRHSPGWTARTPLRGPDSRLEARWKGLIRRRRMGRPGGARKRSEAARPARVHRARAIGTPEDVRFQRPLGKTPRSQIEYVRPLGAAARRSGTANVATPSPPTWLPNRSETAVA